MPNRLAALALVLTFAGTGAAAAPLPKPRPAAAVETAPTQAPAPPAEEADAGGVPPLPRGRPEDGGGEAVAVPPEAPEGAAPPADTATAPPPDETACRQRLAALGVAFKPAPPIDDGPACRVPAPVSVASLGEVALSPPALLTCPAAEALALWLRDDVAPAARSELGTEVAAITQSSTYVCRTRNHVPGAKMSEHARANAIDIAALRFTDGRDFVVAALAGEAPEMRRFRHAIRAAACGPFRTVLGPGSDATHADHLHLDMAERRNGGRYCK